MTAALPPEAAADIAAQVAVIPALVARLSAPGALWSRADLAVYFDCSDRQVGEYTRRPDFQPAIRPGGTGHPRYASDEVRAWALRWREKI
jgi:hypothetical protein